MKPVKVSAYEISISYKDFTFLCIFGKRHEGGYIAILNFNVSAELNTSRGSVHFNAEKIEKALSLSEYAPIIEKREMRLIAEEISATVTPLIASID